MTVQRHPALLQAPNAPAIGLRPIDVEAFTHGLVQAYLEFRAGRRSIEQLRPHVSAPLLRRLRRRAQRRLPAPAVHPVVRVRVWQRDQHTYSLLAIVKQGDRRPAITGQLRHDGTRWLVTELTAPEDLERPSGDICRRTPAERARAAQEEVEDAAGADLPGNTTNLVA